MVAHAAQNPVAPKRQRIGLLFVHGIGQQKRFEHVSWSVLQISELMRQCESDASVSVIDRTSDWKFPPGELDPAGTAPMTLTYRSGSRWIIYDCYEAWWADLGARSGILDQIRFWIWAFGQWCAPIYRELDAAELPKDRQGYNKPVSILVKLPQPVAGQFWRECLSRLKLLWAGIAAAFVLVTWSLAKRLASWLLRQAPGPTLIVQYVGDVHTYEQRAAPGDTSLPDPGCPLRVGIRRRMIAEMIGLATQPNLDGWYLVAHSLGSVIGYNALTEIGHALPNYLPRAQWYRVPPAYKRDDGCKRRTDVNAMMPARPDWLGSEDVINRPMLFERLRGFLTYGSPLDKFAAIWPRIVATADDRSDHAEPLRNCNWVNLAAPQDPIADVLTRFKTGDPPLLSPSTIPVVNNLPTCWWIDYLLAHIRYFAGAERWVRETAAKERRSVAQWLIGIEQDPDPELFRAQSLFRHVVLIYGAYALVFGALVIGTAKLVSIAAGKIAAPWSLFSVAGFLMAAATVTVAFCGFWRWSAEASLNVSAAEFDRTRNPKDVDYWDGVLRMLKSQKLAAVLLGLSAAQFIICGIVVDVYGGPARGFATVVTASLSIVAAIAVQSLINKFVPRLRRQAAPLPHVQPAFAAVQAAAP